MKSTMKAAVVREFGGPLVIEEVPIPVPGPGEVLVQVMANGVCHTDLHAVNGDWPSKPQLPFIPGHEVAGRVAKLGPGVTLLKEGDPVGVAWLHDACGSCEYCLTGWETLCPDQHNTGYSINGGFAEYVIAAAAYVGKLPDQPDFAEMAPILCAGVTTYKGIKVTGAKPGEWIVISGAGGLGHIGVQYAKAMGLHVAVLDVTREKLALALSVGADLAVNATDADAAAQIISATGGGAHGVLVTAPSPTAIEQSLETVRRGGTLVLVGLPPGHFPLPIIDVILRGITIRGSIVGTRKDLAEAISFAHEGKVRAEIHRIRLETINEALTDLSSGQVKGRTVIDFT